MELGEEDYNKEEISNLTLRGLEKSGLQFLANWESIIQSWEITVFYSIMNDGN